jgi:hypothetical protein
MHFTIDSPSRQSALVSDAARSLAELARHARSLGSLSANAKRLADDVTRSYHAALFGTAAGPPAEAWARLVGAAQHLVDLADSLAAIGRLRADEVRARAFFAQLVSENEDLLETYALA